MKIGIMAPGRGIDPASIERVAAIVGDRAALIVHPQCHLSAGHFAGSDAERLDAFLALANDPAIDAIWFARGGYGAGRIAAAAKAGLTEAARAKTYLGYSDAGFLLAMLHGEGASVAHGPMPADIRRIGGEAAIERAIGWLVARDPAALEQGLGATPAFAFNLVILGHLVGTPFLPEIDGCDLLVEEVAEPIYQIDRIFCQLADSGLMTRIASLRLGRVSDVPPNDPDFGCDEEAVARLWCDRVGIPYAGRADIGHDADNKVVPFGGT